MSTMFWIWRFLFRISIAKSGSWETNVEGGEKLHHFLAVHIVEDTKYNNKALAIIIGPFSLIVGFV